MAAHKGGVWHAVLSNGAWRIYPLALLYVTGLSMMLNILPGLMVDYAARRRAGRHVRCEDFAPAAQPPACRDAYADVVSWSTATSCITAVLLFFTAPVIGACSDAWGRRPFLLATTALGCGPPLAVLLHLQHATPLALYYPALVLAGCVHLRTIALATLANMLRAAHRASGFGALMAVFGIGNLLGPLISSMLDATAAAYAACGTRLAGVAYVLLMIPPRLLSRPDTNSEAPTTEKVWAHVSGLRILLRSPLLMRLTACLMLSSMVTDGLDDLLVQYFKLRFNISVDDITAVYILYGVCEVLVETVILRYLLKWAGEARVLMTALLAGLLQMLLVAFCTSKWQAIGGILLWTLADMAYPAISGINANHAAASEQGAIQGAMDGANALASGVGPLPLAAAFAAFTSSSSPLPYFPGAPFLLAAALLAMAAGCALSVVAWQGTDGGVGGASAPLLADDVGALADCSEDGEVFAAHPSP